MGRRGRGNCRGWFGGGDIKGCVEILGRVDFGVIYR